MKILSLFDGMSCGQIALNRIGITDYTYYASEIDKYAIQITQKNYPDTIFFGDIRDISISNGNHWLVNYNIKDTPVLSKYLVDLLIGGSPCQGFSFAGKQLNFEDERSKLFFEYVRILKEVKPRYFLLENVKMKKEYQDVISEQLYGIQPIEINSALVSAQRRKRLYRVGELQNDGSYKQVEISQPQDRGIFLKDILQTGDSDIDKSYCIDGNYFKGGNLKTYFKNCKRQIVFNSCIVEGIADIKGFDIIKRAYSIKGKCPTITAICGGNQQKKIVIDRNSRRNLTPIECERLQTVPDNYTEGVSNSQRYKMLGNSWTVDVIAHLFNHLNLKTND